MENGDYKWQKTENTEKKLKAFLACKDLYEGLHEDDLKKVGYYG